MKTELRIADFFESADRLIEFGLIFDDGFVQAPGLQAFRSP